MLQLSELEMRILAELEEAGQGDVPTVMNVVFLPNRSPEDLDSYLSGLRILVEQDLVRLSTSLGPGRRLSRLSISESLLIINDQINRLKFDFDLSYWVDTQSAKRPQELTFPFIVITSSGRKKSHEIMSERGYQWWAPIA
jgi:hypothetical protein